jgi:hypothetical protein
MIPLFFALLLAQDKTIVEGTVINGLTNEPLRKAHVTLNLDEKTSYEVLTSDQGKFRFEGMEPELYQLFAERQGFLDADGGWMEIAAGEQVKDVIVKMTPQSAISGHVIDEDGDPIPGAHVLVERKISMVVLDRKEKVADEEGYFFAGALRGGRYHITVTPPERESSNGPAEDLVRTEDPIPVDIATGAVARNVEVRMRRGRVFHIHGRVSNWPHPGIPVELMPTGSHARLEDGKFAFEGVAPGNYFLNASSLRGCPVPVTVSDHDIDALLVEVAPSPSIVGKIKIEGAGHFATPTTIALKTGQRGPEFSLAAKEDGTFGGSLSPEKYTLDYTPPDGFYVKSVEFNRQPSPDHTIDLTSCIGGTLDISVAPNAATISATVRNAKPVKVTLWSDSTLKTEETEDGNVTFSNLAPGEYRILAWENVKDEYLAIPEFRACFEAQKVTLAEGSNENVELKLVPKSASDAEIAKLQ